MTKYFFNETKFFIFPQCDTILYCEILISRNLPFEFRQIDVQYFSVKSWFDGIFSKPYFTALILLRKFRQFIFIIKERYSTYPYIGLTKKTIYVDGRVDASFFHTMFFRKYHVPNYLVYCNSLHSLKITRIYFYFFDENYIGSSIHELWRCN